MPDDAPDQRLPEALTGGDYKYWRERTIEETDAAGHHAMLNWHVLGGAMSALGRSPEIQDFVETFFFRSSKCYAVFAPK